MKIMKDLKVVSNEYKHYFEPQLREAIIYFQEKGWEVEVQFSPIGLERSPHREFHALVMAYENPVSKG